ncbi:MAG TPA: DNA repair protein RecN [Trueperaceae bacterium]|nr:DNA repair protein RecN [Trueperaceae bacterium]
MLRTLELRDFAIVDALELELAGGFNALTGETGAGKSILVDALSLLSGGRADGGMIRAEREAALVQGAFEGASFTSAARRLARNGRHSARIDGEIVTVAELAERSARLVAIFGQHGAADLIRGAEQRAQLDRLLDADARAELQRYRDGYRRLQEATRRLAERAEASRERARRVDMLRFQVEEIDAATLSPGEDERLEAEAEALRHAERIRLGASRAADELTEVDGSATERSAAALAELRSAARHQPSLDALVRDLEEAVSGLQAVANEVEGFLSGFEADPARLDAVQARLALIEALRRKYGASLDEVLAYRASAAEELDRIAGAEQDTRALETEAAALSQELADGAARLSGSRRRAAETLERRMLPLLAELGMEQARFEVELRTEDELHPSGQDAVRFLFVANPGEPLAPLAAVASGGELSRVMLALNLVTGSEVPVLVFDEIDAGIGGRTARSVGALLRRLSERHQVLVVTHLPQVAAFADAQYSVTKEVTGDRTVTRVTPLGETARREELARMLSGKVTPTSLRHATELLEQATGLGSE